MVALPVGARGLLSGTVIGDVLQTACLKPQGRLVEGTIAGKSAGLEMAAKNWCQASVRSKTTRVVWLFLASDLLSVPVIIQGPPCQDLRRHHDPDQHLHPYPSRPLQEVVILASPPSSRFLARAVTAA